MKVAVAVIFDKEERVLITRRPLHAPHGGMWEFPGGKLEANELPSEALIREIKEEVGIDILGHVYLGDVTHSYGMKTVQLLVFSVTEYKGHAACYESQIDLRWVALQELANYDFPEANSKIIRLIKNSELTS